MSKFKEFIGPTLLVTALSSQFVLSDSIKKFEVGVRADGNLSSGEPANDILGGSILGRYRINRDWWIGVGVEFAEFDVEQPYKSIGLTSSEVIDATSSSEMFSVWAERRYNENLRGGYWFWTAGLGINSHDVDDIIGTTKSGNTFDLETEVDNETIITFTAGRRHKLSRNWAIGYGVRLEHRRGDWTIFNRETGDKQRTIDSYNIHGAFVSTSYSF